MRFLVLYIHLLILNYVVAQDEKISALILARGGSKGVRLKNMQTVGGVSLICRSVLTAKGAGIFDVTVSTDHPLIALESLKCGASVIHRSKVTATDFAPSIWGTAEFLHRRPDISILVLMQATTPFIRISKLKEALSKIIYPTAYDCIFTVVRSFKLRWQDLENSKLPVNFNVLSRPRRQDWNGELIETGAFYITRRHLIEQGYFQNFK